MREARTTYRWEYEEYSDEELEEMIRDNYDLDEDSTALTVFQPFRLAVSNTYEDAYPDHQITARLREIQQYYDPNKGRFRMWLDEIKSQRRARNVQTMNSEMMAVIERGKMLEDQAMDNRRKRTEFQTFLADNQFLVYKMMMYAERIKQAVAEGVTTEGLEQSNLYRMKTSDDIRKERELSIIRGDEEERKTKIANQQLADQKRIELDSRWEEIEQDSDAADLEAMAQQLVLKKLRDELIQARRERRKHDLEETDQVLRVSILKDYDRYIKNLEKQIHATEAGSIQTKNRKNA